MLSCAVLVGHGEGGLERVAWAAASTARSLRLVAPPRPPPPPPPNSTLCRVARFYAQPKGDRKATYSRWWTVIKKEAKHYWVGGKWVGWDRRAGGLEGTLVFEQGLLSRCLGLTRQHAPFTVLLLTLPPGGHQAAVVRRQDCEPPHGQGGARQDAHAVGVAGCEGCDGRVRSAVWCRVGSLLLGRSGRVREYSVCV